MQGRSLTKISENITDYIPYLLSKANARMKAELNRQFSEQGFNLTADQWIVLNFLSPGAGFPQAKLAERTGKEKTSLARILFKMEKQGLIERKVHKHDRRMYMIHVTDSGVRTMQRLAPFARRVEVTALNSFTNEEAAELRRLIAEAAMAVASDQDQ